MWSEDAALLLAAATAAAPAGARSLLAGGLRAAHDCHQVIVVPSAIGPNPAYSRGVSTGLPGGSCAYVPAITLNVVYTRDCYPMPSVTREGGVTLPDPDLVTGWTTTYLDACQDILAGVLDVAAGNLPPGVPGDTPPLGGGCEGVTVGPATFTGPLGGHAWLTIPVTLANLLPS